ncbi:hypothetical protein B0H15DRAFT_188151 [Mycena belliarum]|uniref:F-box domain-containing protein n=1 Tax=Mycena belliarum TaxID=1033014 RepID=A0AAD6UGU6_9AGAR|nr:hypothetical protein B0H15DRAFT_188151 [Mycena belliae]
MTSTVLLRPRPYAQSAGSFFLVALLPSPKALPSLPSELWAVIFESVSIQSGFPALWSLLTVCRKFKDLVLPLLYARVQFSKIVGLENFATRLHAADQRWDSICRIPWSAPGRWVQSLDLSRVALVERSQTLLFDSLLVKLLPLLPFLARFSINPVLLLSRRLMEVLGDRQGAVNIRALEGISYVPSGSPKEEPLTQLLRRCPNIEELEIIGQGLDPTEMEIQIGEPSQPDSFVPLNLPFLRTLTILSVHSSSLLLSLLLSPLPSLQKLTITPFDDVPAALSSQFIARHSAPLRSLLLFTPKSWPTRLHTSPQTLLSTAPTLRHLSLEKPLPSHLIFPPEDSHPLQLLSIPRPDANFWVVLERMLPRLPGLRAVRARDVRWLRKGMGLRAQEAGVQGEMREWRRRLLRRGIRVLDAEWKECE